jgi:hypothetical protein
VWPSATNPRFACTAAEASTHDVVNTATASHVDTMVCVSQQVEPNSSTRQQNLLKKLQLAGFAGLKLSLHGKLHRHNCLVVCVRVCAFAGTLAPAAQLEHLSAAAQHLIIRRSLARQ